MLSKRVMKPLVMNGIRACNLKPACVQKFHVVVSKHSMHRYPTSRITQMGAAAHSTIKFPHKAQDFEFKNLVDLHHKASELYPTNPMFGTFDLARKEYDWLTYDDIALKVQQFRNVLKHHNIGKNDKVAIISNNRVEWAVCSYATLGVGAQIVPM